MKMKALIFDMDGVVVDTEPIHMQAFRTFLADKNINYSEDFILSLVGHSVRENVSRIQKELSETAFDIEAGVQRRNDIYLNMLKNSPLTLCPGVLELLTRCRQQSLKVGLATSSDAVQAETILNRVLNPGFSFDAIVTGSDVRHRKPAPDIYIKIIEKLQIHADEAATIEDSSAGIESAKSAGLYCFALETRHNQIKDLIKADKIVSSFDEIRENIFREV